MREMALEGTVNTREWIRQYLDWEAGAPERQRQAAVEAEWRLEELCNSWFSMGALKPERVDEYRQTKKDREAGYTPAEAQQRRFERMRAAEMAERVENLEECCAQWIADDVAELGADADLDGLRVLLKQHWFPPDVEVQARIDRVFDSAVAAGLVGLEPEPEVDAAPVPEPEAALVPEPEPHLVASGFGRTDGPVGLAAVQVGVERGIGRS